MCHIQEDGLCAAAGACCCMQVKDAMVGKDKVVTVKPGAPMSEAAQLMVHNDVSVGATPWVWRLHNNRVLSARLLCAVLCCVVCPRALLTLQ